MPPLRCDVDTEDQSEGDDMNDLVRVEKQLPLSAADVRSHVNLVQEVMKAVMQEGTHYGKIPGTPKPSLWKPGAEVLAATFRIAVSYQSEDLSDADHMRYRVTAIGTHQTTGIVMGSGMGECSSNEEKYKWRKANSRKEFEATTENRRRIKYGYDRQASKEYEIQQVRTEPADVANTILKMACKRAQVAMTLNVTAASDIFTQDIEDLPEELRHDDDEAQRPALVPGPQARSAQPQPSHPGTQTNAASLPPQPVPPEKKNGTAQPISPGAQKMLRAKMARTSKTDADLQAKFGYATPEAVTTDKINQVLEWASTPAAH
jgi:hypothetical protein